MKRIAPALLLLVPISLLGAAGKFGALKSGNQKELSLVASGVELAQPGR